MQYYPDAMQNYLQPIYELILMVNEENLTPETKLAAIGCLPGLIKISKNIPNYNFKTLGKDIFAKLWEIFVNEENPSYKADYCYNL